MGPCPDAELSLAKEKVFRLFRHRPRSEKEVESYLRKKTFSPGTIKQTVNEFRRLGLLDDRLFTRAWIRSRISKPFGYRRIRQELKNKGINEEIAQEEWENQSGDYREYDAILKLARQRRRVCSRLDPVTAQRRIYGYLIRRGFPSATVQKALIALFRGRFENGPD